MTTEPSRAAAHLMTSPAVIILLLWMILPMMVALYLAFRCHDLSPSWLGTWTGSENYNGVSTQPAFWLMLTSTHFPAPAMRVIPLSGGVAPALLPGLKEAGGAAVPSGRTESATNFTGMAAIPASPEADHIVVHCFGLDGGNRMT